MHFYSGWPPQVLCTLRVPAQNLFPSPHTARASKALSVFIILMIPASVVSSLSVPMILVERS